MSLNISIVFEYDRTCHINGIVCQGLYLNHNFTLHSLETGFSFFRLMCFVNSYNFSNCLSWALQLRQSLERELKRRVCFVCSVLFISSKCFYWLSRSIFQQLKKKVALKFEIMYIFYTEPNVGEKGGTHQTSNVYIIEWIYLEMML